MEKPKTIMCSNCGVDLSSDDEIYVDNDDYVYCSKHCLNESNVQEKTTVQEYIDEMEFRNIRTNSLLKNILMK